ncbi:MAG: EamA family transporter RarD [Halioglobus sp.]
MADLYPQISDHRRGALYGVTAYLIWGFSALYWVHLDTLDTRDVLAHRAVWTLPAVTLLLLIGGRLSKVLQFMRQPRTMMIMACAALLSATNWGIFLWAIANEQATEASFGYFLLPLLNIVIGLSLFGERIDTSQKLGVAFAIAAVLAQVVYFRGLPLVSLGLALTFGLYGAIRKKVSVEPLEGLFLESLLMLPFALLWLASRDWGGLGSQGLKTDLLLVGAGIFSAVPLLCYITASRLLPLTALGLVFYIGPTAQLFVAVLVFGEILLPIQLLAFSLVWFGLMLVAADNFRRARRLRRPSAAPSATDSQQ